MSAAARAWLPKSMGGEEEELTPSGLVAAAAAEGYGPKEDWVAAVAQLRQAEADAAVMRRVLRGLMERQQQLEAAVAVERRARTEVVEEAQQQAAALTSKFEALLEQQQRAHDDVRAAAVRAAEDRVAADAARHQAAERLERSKSLDGLRGEVNTLALALTRRKDEAEAGSGAHCAALGALALARALEEGRPVKQELRALHAGASPDRVVAAVEASLPPSAADAGLPTRGQLEERFERLAKATRQLSYFPPNAGGGPLSHAAAAAAAALKVDPGPAAAAAGAVGACGVDARLSQARAHLRAGRLLAAADALAQAAAGSEATGAVEGWVADAQARALADQNARLLQAHATSTAASLA
ncbi:MAG: mitochondrial inner membrane protein-domain-containing protein [Monoraphidium minutum]|nr:MAG: mitochondrial inner membrane protein-domain-containing protein [Monoraphidium minutum]